MRGVDAQEGATGTPGAALALLPAGDPPAHQTGRSSVLSRARGAFPLLSKSRRLRWELAPALGSVLPSVASCGLGQREARRQGSPRTFWSVPAMSGRGGAAAGRAPVASLDGELSRLQGPKVLCAWDGLLGRRPRVTQLLPPAGGLLRTEAFSPCRPRDGSRGGLSSRLSWEVFCQACAA